MRPDHVNAIFEAGGAVLLLLNVRRLWQDKRLAGVALAPTLWFNVWGAWNLYFYAAVGQRWSWLAGMAVFAVNSAWVGLALYYRWRARRELGCTLPPTGWRCTRVAGHSGPCAAVPL